MCTNISFDKKKVLSSLSKKNVSVNACLLLKFAAWLSS